MRTIWFDWHMSIVNVLKQQGKRKWCSSGNDHFRKNRFPVRKSMNWSRYLLSNTLFFVTRVRQSLLKFENILLNSVEISHSDGQIIYILVIKYYRMKCSYWRVVEIDYSIEVEKTDVGVSFERKDFSTFQGSKLPESSPPSNNLW